MRTFILAGALVMAAATVLPAQSARDRDRDPQDISRIDTTLAIGTNGTVDLNVVGGSIVVTGTDSRQVRIVATSERGSLRLEHSTNRITLRLDRARGRGGDTEYRVTVPPGVRVLTSSTSGDISVKGTRGDVEATTMSGDVTIADITGSVSSETLSGDIDIAGITGNVRVQSVSGDVSVTRATGNVEVESVSGEIGLRTITSKAVRGVTVSGEVDFDGSIAADGRYDLRSHSGDVRVALPPGVNALVGVSTFSGEIDSDFPLTLEPGQRRTQGRQFEFRLGSGGARIDLESFSGDIYLVRGTGSRNRQGGNR